MSGNGHRPPRRPRISIGGAPDPEEAAAVAVALERFLTETAAVPTPSPPRSRWLLAALREGVERAPATSAWGEVLRPATGLRRGE